MKEITLPAIIESISRVTAFVDEQLEALDCPMKAQMQIDVAIDELFGNIARYAYAPGTGEAAVRFDFDADTRTVSITFLDSGIPFDPLARAAPDIHVPAAERGVAVFSSMGAAARLDPSRIRATPFRKVEGDGLARALRRRFKEDGWPAREFTCVWSDEPPANLGERSEEDGAANGSLMPVTASFGLRLASLALSFIGGAHG